MKYKIKHAKRIIRLLFPIAILTWLIIYSDFHLSHIFDYFTQVRLSTLIIIILLFLLHIYLTYKAWLLVLFSIGIYIPWWDIAVIFSTSNIAKYIPGGIWQISSRIYGLTKKGANTTKVLLSLFTDQILAITMSLILTILFFSKSHLKSYLPLFSDISQPILTTLAITLLFTCSLPWIYSKILKLLSRYFKIDILVIPKFKQLLTINGLHIISLIIFSISYFIIIKSYIPSFSMGIINFISLIMLATFSGFIAIFSPAGLGVRETILFIGLQPELDKNIALLVTIIPRILIIISEFIFYFMSLSIHYYKKQRQ